MTPRERSISMTLRWPPVRMPRLLVITRFLAPALASHTASASPKPPSPPVMMYERSSLQPRHTVSKLPFCLWHACVTWHSKAQTLAIYPEQ